MIYIYQLKEYYVCILLINLNMISQYIIDILFIVSLIVQCETNYTIVGQLLLYITVSR